MSLFLNEPELEQLTGRKQTAAQCRALDELGIRWKVNAAGDLLVGRRHVDEVFCGHAEGTHASTRKAPNFGALSA